MPSLTCAKRRGKWALGDPSAGKSANASRSHLDLRLHRNPSSRHPEDWPQDVERGVPTVQLPLAHVSGGPRVFRSEASAHSGRRGSAVLSATPVRLSPSLRRWPPRSPGMRRLSHLSHPSPAQRSPGEDISSRAPASAALPRRTRRAVHLAPRPRAGPPMAARQARSTWVAPAGRGRDERSARIPNSLHAGAHACKPPTGEAAPRRGWGYPGCPPASSPRREGTAGWLGWNAGLGGPAGRRRLPWYSLWGLASCRILDACRRCG